MELSRGARRQGARMYEARFKQIDDFRGGAADTGGQFRLVDAIISKIALECENRRRQSECVEIAEERTKLMFGDQAMHRASAGRGEQHQLSRKRVRPDEIKEMFESAGVRALEYRRPDDERISGLDCMNGRTRFRRQPLRREGMKQMRP